MRDDKDTYRILVIDDEMSNLLILHEILSADYTIFIAKSAKEGLILATIDKPDLILLDIIMPDMDGFEVLKRLKESADMCTIPVIIITGLEDEEDEEKGFLLGAVDYIKKPFKNTLVKARVKTHIQILHQIRTIERLGMLDGLTNIPNRRCFNERIDLEWWRALREQRHLSFMMMDMDHFKEYNDTYGHPQGDALLQTLAKILTKAVMRSTDLVARLGGEEFGVLLPNTELRSALRIAEKIRAGMEAARIPTADGRITFATISIGVVSLIPTENITMDSFIAEADTNLYLAKKKGRNQVCARNYKESLGVP
jgi:diguanylate cyclase (GGDEF)-like protein